MLVLTTKFSRQLRQRVATYRIRSSTLLSLLVLIYVEPRSLSNSEDRLLMLCKRVNGSS